MEPRAHDRRPTRPKRGRALGIGIGLVLVLLTTASFGWRCLPTEWLRIAISQNLRSQLGEDIVVGLGSVRLNGWTSIVIEDLVVRQKKPTATTTQEPNDAARRTLFKDKDKDEDSDEPEDDSELLLSAQEIRIDCGVFQWCRPNPSTCTIRAAGWSIPLVQKRDGSWPLWDVLARLGKDDDADDADSRKAKRSASLFTLPNPYADPKTCGITLILKQGVVTIRSLKEESAASLMQTASASATPWIWKDLEGKGHWGPAGVRLEHVRGGLGRGNFAMALEARTGLDAGFQAHLSLEDGEADAFAATCLRYAAPMVSVPHGVLDSRIRLNLHLEAEGKSPSEWLSNLRGEGAIAADPIAVDGTSILTAVAGLAPDLLRGRLGRMQGMFTIGQNRVTTRNLTLTVGRSPINIRGWTDFNGEADYQLELTALTREIPAQAQALLSEVPLAALSAYRISGTWDRLRIELDPQVAALHGVAPQTAREVSQRLQDHFVRWRRDQNLRKTLYGNALARNATTTPATATTAAEDDSPTELPPLPAVMPIPENPDSAPSQNPARKSPVAPVSPWYVWWTKDTSTNPTLRNEEIRVIERFVGKGVPFRIR